jgi:hypothetical protein
MFSRTPAAVALCGFAVLLLSSTIAGRASAPAVDSKSRDAEAEASKFVLQKLQVWQDRMNLKDWDIRVNLVRSDQLEPKTLGNVHWDTDVKKATISVLSPLDYRLEHQAMLEDMECTVVHELVHIELASLPRSDASRRTEEHAVNEIAAALLRLARH